MMGEPPGERILPTAIGEEVLTSGSTRVEMVTHHAGIARTRRYSFKSPFQEKYSPIATRAANNSK